MTKTAVSLDDKYLQESGRVFMSSIQALVRLPLDQVRRDRTLGLSTASLVSGYRGSPIGTYDAALWAAESLLNKNNVRFLPGLNEELAATAIRGTQQLDWFGSATVDGVVGIWYGKHVGLDRAHEALKVANIEGSAAKGGVLAVVGDDHGGKSTVTAQQSEQNFAAAGIPILYPASPTEILSLGLAGIAMSRYSGLYVGLKCVTDTLDLSGTVTLPDYSQDYEKPLDYKLPPAGLNLVRNQTQIEQERSLYEHRLPAARAFARANSIDCVIFDSPKRNLTIVCAGKAYFDVCQALDDLHLGRSRCEQLGVRILKLGLIWPVDSIKVTEALRDTREVLVVEEKRPFIEDQVKEILYTASYDRKPRVLGKSDGGEQPLLPVYGELTPSMVRKAIFTRLDALGLVDHDLQERFTSFRDIEEQHQTIEASRRLRPAFFCSGCPHNTGTRYPVDSEAMAATGCHALPAYLPGSTMMRPLTMGAEGLNWVGAEPFVDKPHMFQNLGDGTYTHSGLLAIRAAVAANSNITYKILYNDAVAMTGGQPAEGALSPSAIARQLVAEGVRPVVVVADPAEMKNIGPLPPDIPVEERDKLDEVQRDLRDVKGVSAIIYVQTCAAEKRRRRKRGTFPKAPKRVYIHSEICEGCGDCSVQANCISIQPKETFLGRKRQIDQSNCNMDYGCLKGFCPSFVTLEGADIARKNTALPRALEAGLASLAEPPAIRQTDTDIMLTGIGGTGVLTVGAIVGMAAHIDGKSAKVLDLTGMAQKGGAVASHIRLARRDKEITAARLDVAGSDAVIACDLIVAAGAECLKAIKPGHTRILANSNVAPTGEFQRDRSIDFGEAPLLRKLQKAVGGDLTCEMPATRIATHLTGDSIATNMLMLGAALQLGMIPISRASIEQAIRLNGVAVEQNLTALSLGRLFVDSPGLFEPIDDPGEEDQEPADVEQLINLHVRLVTEYHNENYARKFTRTVLQVRDAIEMIDAHDTDDLLKSVIRNLSKVMRYKDEYEVGRLMSSPKFWRELEREFAAEYTVNYYLAPPLLSKKDPATGRPRKMKLGPWMRPVFSILGKLRFLRHTPFDVFGYTEERRNERALIADYIRLIEQVLDGLTPQNFPQAIDLLDEIDNVRGFGPVKEAALRRYRQALEARLAAFKAASHQTELSAARTSAV